MFVQTKEAKLYLNIAELLRGLTVGELYKISRNRFDIAEEFEKLAGDTNDSITSDQYLHGAGLVQEVSDVEGIGDLIINYLLGRTAEEEVE